MAWRWSPRHRRPPPPPLLVLVMVLVLLVPGVVACRPRTVVEVAVNAPAVGPSPCCPRRRSWRTTWPTCRRGPCCSGTWVWWAAVGAASPPQAAFLCSSSSVRRCRGRAMAPRVAAGTVA